MSDEIVTIEVVEEVVEVIEVVEKGDPGTPVAHDDLTGIGGTGTNHISDDELDAITNAPTAPTGANPLVTVADHKVLANYTEPDDNVAFVAGAASVDISTSDNTLVMTLTEVSALTFTSPVTNKPVDLVVTHTGGPWTLSLNGTDLGLEGTVADPIEYLTMRYTGVAWHVFRAGVVDVTV